MLDQRLATHLHVESLRRRDLYPEHEPHVLFQASTIGALLDGAYDGDVTIAELAEHGDLGLGTLNALDGEMIVLDGRFYRADIDGLVEELDPNARTPFAALVWFEPSLERVLDRPLSHDRLLAELDTVAADDEASCALRIEGEFERVRARSVPRELPPYRPLAEVVADQHVFELTEVEGTLVGFRFPQYADGIEVGGYHLHFLTADRDPRRPRARVPPATRHRAFRSRRRAPRRAASGSRARIAAARRGDPSGGRAGRARRLRASRSRDARADPAPAASRRPRGHRRARPRGRTAPRSR